MIRRSINMISSIIRFSKTRSTTKLLKSASPNVEIGRYTYGNPRLMIYAKGDKIKIGSFCSISDEVAILGGGEHIKDWITTFPLRASFKQPGAYEDGHPATKGPVTIGSDVWIGYRALILSGVTIGDGAVIGAGAVISRDVPPYAIVAGNPAKVRKMRFEEDIVKMLLEIKWWDWPVDKIIENTEILGSSDIEKLRSLV